jgi:hypothetical protein
MQGKKLFFTDHKKIILLESFLQKMESISSNNIHEDQVRTHLINIIQAMLRAPKDWDDYCQVTVKSVGDEFIQMISNQEIKIENLNAIFSWCFSFTFEAFLTFKNGIEPELEEAIQFGIDNVENFDGKPREFINLTIKKLPIVLVRSLLTSEGAQDITKSNGIS